MVEKVANHTLERLKNVQWQKFFHMYYIEPIIFVLVFAHSLSGTILRNQIIYQICTTIFNYDVSECQQLGTKNLSDRAKAIETEIQPYSANLFMIRTLLESIVPAICGVFIGSWSDRYGRKPLLLISMIGFSFTYLIAAAICELSKYYAVNPWYYILAAVPHSVLGGNCVFSVAAFCFLSDVTDLKTRPYRMIFMEAYFFIGLTSGSILSSFVYEATSATATFIISGVSMCLATMFIAIYVPESLHYKAEQEKKGITSTNGEERKETADGVVKLSELPVSCDAAIAAVEAQAQVEKEKGTKSKSSELDKNSVKGSEKDKSPEDDNDTKPGLFSYVHIKDMLNTTFKQRPCYDRCIILLITGVMFISIFVIDGNMNVFYLFAREKFHWTVRDFTFFETVSHMVPMFGAILGFLVLRKLFSLSVVSLALLAFLSDFFSSFVKGVAAEPWHLYLSVAVGVFKSVGGPMCRTIVSNIVPPTDLGKIFSIKNILQSVAPFLAAPLYTLIYNNSLTVYPGLFNLVSAALYLIACVFLIVVIRFKWTHKEHYAKTLK